MRSSSQVQSSKHRKVILQNNANIIFGGLASISTMELTLKFMHHV